MKAIQLEKNEKMLLTLLKASLNEQQAIADEFTYATPDDWSHCVRLAREQGVMALAWDGVLTLPPELMPPKGLKVKWAFAVEQYEKRYAYYCHIVQELQDFYASHGIAMMQLKGVGFSRYYPVPSHREGGDIDIFTWSADRNKLSDQQANALADKLMEQQGILVDRESPKHSHFIFKRIPVENHKFFLDKNYLPLALSMEKILQSYLGPDTANLLGGDIQIKSPNKNFDSIFIAFHALQHYGAGLCLHHLFDWACLLKREGLCLPSEVRNPAFLNFIYALTEVSNRWLGTKVEVPVCEKNVEMLIKEILWSIDVESYSWKNPFLYVGQKMDHIKRFYWERSSFLDEPFFKIFGRSCWNHLKF